MPSSFPFRSFSVPTDWRTFNSFISFLDWKWGSRKNNCTKVNFVFLHQWLLCFRQVLGGFLEEKMKIHLECLFCVWVVTPLLLRDDWMFDHPFELFCNAKSCGELAISSTNLILFPSFGVWQRNLMHMSIWHSGSWCCKHYRQRYLMCMYQPNVRMQKVKQLNSGELESSELDQ